MNTAVTINVISNDTDDGGINGADGHDRYPAGKRHGVSECQRHRDVYPEEAFTERTHSGTR